MFPLMPPLIWSKITIRQYETQPSDVKYKHIFGFVDWGVDFIYGLLLSLVHLEAIP